MVSAARIVTVVALDEAIVYISYHSLSPLGDQPHESDYFACLTLFSPMRLHMFPLDSKVDSFLILSEDETR